MSNLTDRSFARQTAIDRADRLAKIPRNNKEEALKVSEFFGENVFNISKAKGIPSSVKEELDQIASSGKPLTKELAEVVAQAVTEWAVSKGATHFCHWFQPLTGSTAEKHDAFLSFDNDQAIEKLSAGQLMQGEPDASSFPSGGSRTTFEARGYTAWDLSSPMFLVEGINGKTLCIPTAFVSYHGDALDIKTPLLRSTNRLSKVASEFVRLTGAKDSTHVNVTCGCEQEYFLVDKSFYYLRPDLMQTERTLFGQLTARNQQLEDHYFGDIPDRVLSFMQELEIELYRLGIPAKTRHNEVAPGQFELAPVFKNANVAADHNQLVMAMIKKIALKHNFVALLHEKPFAGVNGSGKHLNWSLACTKVGNLLEPGQNPQDNHRFLATAAIICEAVYRHSDALRMAIGSHGNDHRLGANEAPPSIISIFLGDTLAKIFETIEKGASFNATNEQYLDIGAEQLARLLKDNTDRNRTSPFAFTGNKFEFRAVGSTAAIGFPLCVLNAAVAEVFEESNAFLKQEIEAGKEVGAALEELTQKWVKSSKKVIFNGDGYSDEWVKEAQSRGLPNLKTTAEALEVLKNQKAISFLTETSVFRASELEMRYNVLLERYIKHREIEFESFTTMIHQYVVPAVVDYKVKLQSLLEGKAKGKFEEKLCRRLIELTDKLYDHTDQLDKEVLAAQSLEEDQRAKKYAAELMPKSEEMAALCSEIEELLPDGVWPLPKYLDMLFVR